MRVRVPKNFNNLVQVQKFLDRMDARLRLIEIELGFDDFYFSLDVNKLF